MYWLPLLRRFFGNAVPKRTKARNSLRQFESLEPRAMMSVAQAVIETNFTGTNANSPPAGSIPDTMGSVGPSHVVELLNSSYAVYDKSNGSLITRTSADSFWNTALFNGNGGTTSNTCDPRIVYDHASQRWFATGLDRRSISARNILVGVSNTSDPTQGWKAYLIDPDPTDLYFADFPTLGMDADGVYIHATMHDYKPDGIDPPYPLASSVISVPKHDLVAPVPTVANATVFANMNVNSGKDPVTWMHPAIDFGPSDGMASMFFGSASGFDRSDIFNAAGPGPATLGRRTSNYTFVYRDPPDATQPGTSTLIETGASFYRTSVYQVNNTIWNAFGVDVGGRAAIAWRQVDLATNVILQSGTISDPDLHLYMPSLAVNQFGDVVIGCTGSSSTQSPSAYAVVGETRGGTTSFGDLMLLKQGTGNFGAGFTGPMRWGDYSATVPDPSDPRAFWTFQEFVQSNSVWGIQITKINVGNQAPTAIELSNNTIAENSPAPTIVGQLNTTDADADAFTYAFVSGEGDTDNALFSIEGNVLKATSAFDYEAKSTYSIRVRSTDFGGLSTEQVLTIAVTNKNESPADISLTESTIAENLASGTAVGNFSTSDPDTNETFTYTLVGGEGSVDNGSFTIAGNALHSAATFNFEAKNSYSIRVRSTDAGGLWTEKVFTISVSDVNDVPSAIGLTNRYVAENAPIGSIIGDFGTTDDDVNDTFTYTLVTGEGGTDNAQFQILNGQLITAASFDFETKSSYSIRVRTTDAGGASFEQMFTIAVTNVNEGPTALTLSKTTVQENLPSSTPVGDFSTTDPDADDTFIYTLVAGEGGTDNALFTIVGGQLVTASNFDFETKSSYSIRVRTTDAGGASFEQMFTIAVTNVNEGPTALALFSDLVAENSVVGTIVGDFSTTDPDAGDTFTYTLVTGEGDTDNAQFQILNGQLVTAASFDFEVKSSYSIRVRTTDAGGASFEQAFTIAVTNVNETPTALALSNDLVAENSVIGTIVGDFSTTDPDSNDTFIYQLVSGEGDADNAQFQIVDGQLVTAANFDFETKSSYAIRVRTTDDGGLSTEQVFTISVSNVNEGPTALALSKITAFENLPSGTPIGDFSTTDPDMGDTFIYTFVAGEGDADNALFTVVDGQLVTAASFDYEARNSYSLRVRSTDQEGLFTEQVFNITIANTNDAPVLNAALEPALSAIKEDSRNAWGTPVGMLLAGASDADAGAVRGLAILGATGTTQGVWQFTLDSGANWQALGEVSRASARLLAARGNEVRIRFVPNANFNGTVSIEYVVWDQTQGSSGETFDLSGEDALGGTTAFSAQSRTSRLTITPVNDAPKLNTALSPTLTAINENNRNAWGTPVWMLLPGYSDVDAGALKGLAITSASGRANGAWQYTLDGGATWLDLGAVSLSAAKLLPAQGNLSRVRFVPNANFHGTVQLGYFAWDQAQGASGGTFDLSGSGKFGGTTAFGWGYETASLTVKPVNNPPRLTLPSASVGYALNSPAVLLASTATLKDPDTVRFAGGWLKVQITSGGDANDRLSMGGPFKVVEGNLIWNNQATIGTVQGGAGSSALLINLNTNATLYRVEQLVRSIKFGTLGSSKPGLRTVAFSVSDGTSNSDVATLDVQVA